MGYYTNFTIEHDGNDEEFITVFNEVSDYRGLLDDQCGTHYMNAKWYCYEKDMLEISGRMPGVLFTVSGEGEENDDIWKSYFKDGKTQFCQAIVTFEPYDEGKMK